MGRERERERNRSIRHTAVARREKWKISQKGKNRREKGKNKRETSKEDTHFNAKATSARTVKCNKTNQSETSNNKAATTFFPRSLEEEETSRLECARNEAFTGALNLLKAALPVLERQR